MTNNQPIPWRRLLAEGAAIVLSILLAFWIDAWWQQRAETRQSDALIRGLHADFEASQEHLQEWLDGNRRVLHAASEFLDEIRKAATGDEILVRQEWLVAAVSAPTFDPTDTALRTAVATGQIELITDPELRNALAIWQQQLSDTREDELLIRQIVVGHLVPELAKQLRLGRTFEFDPMVNWFTGRKAVHFEGDYLMQVTSEIESLLAEKVYFVQFVVYGLADIDQTQKEILGLLARGSHAR